MIRLKYVIDNWVFINNEYQTTYEDFEADCTALNISNPLKKGELLLYTPPRIPEDRKRGIEYINNEGHSAEGDNVVNPNMQKIIDYVDNFVSQSAIRLKTEEAQRMAALPIEEKLQRAYLEAWPTHKQLEAFQDKLNGDNVKFDKMNVDFAEIKSLG